MKAIKNKKSELTKEFSELIKDLEKGYLWSIAQLPVTEMMDLYLAYNHLFTKAAKKAVPFENVNTDKVAYLTCVAVGEDNVLKAAEEIIAAVNGLAKYGYVTGFLMKLSAAKLSSDAHEEEKWVILSFPSLTEKGHVYLKSTKWGVITDENQEFSNFEIRT